MINLMQIVTLKWNKSNRKYYSEKGYDYTKSSDCFSIFAKDLPRGSHEYVKVHCDICMQEQNVTFRDYNSNVERNGKYVCQSCSVSVRHRKTLENRRIKYMKELKDKCLENGYDLISSQDEILNNTSYIRYKCPIHGEQSMRISNFINGKKCPKCCVEEKSTRYRLQENEIVSKVLDCGGEIINSGDYINQSTKNLKFRCANCGSIFVSTLQRFLQHGGQLCKECSKTESVGEVRIRKYLEGNNVYFKQQYCFPNCKDIKPLPFDFYIPDRNIIIEFDGRQHFEETNIFTYSLDRIQLHDKIKNDYCNKNGINLIRIPYTKINHINEILDKELFT